MNKNDIEKWLLSRGVFVDCTKCPKMTVGCYKKCKFYKAYKRRAKNEQRKEYWGNDRCSQKDFWR